MRKVTCAGLVRWYTLSFPRILPRFEGLGGGEHGGIWPNAAQRKYQRFFQVGLREVSSAHLGGETSAAFSMN